MLGEQLIKNERIALIELLKNSYDADAEWVKVSFINFGEDYEVNKNSTIVIEDNGEGMTSEIIEKHWLNPATPVKMKNKEKMRTTKKGRIVQGEKGIGRFAILKLGRKIDIITRFINDEKEHLIEYDFSKYDDEFLSENGINKELFIDDLNISLINRTPINLIKRNIDFGIGKKIGPPHGTIIQISNLKGSWSEKKVEYVYKDISKLQSIFSSENDRDFHVVFYKDSEKLHIGEKYQEKLHFLLQQRAVLQIENGRFDEQHKEYQFKINGNQKTIKLTDPKISGLRVFRDYFGKKGEELKKREIECGSFDFGFYIFDFSNQAPTKYLLDKEDKKIISDHRIYLYRDNIRVYPYGEPEDDWLNIDVSRGTVSAGQFFSNDQVVGFINISQDANPKLKDKTNREGLISEGNATEDFISLIQIFLSYLRSGDYERYRKGLKNKNKHDIFKTEQIKNDIDQLKKLTKGSINIQELLNKIEKEYTAERNYLIRRAEITEDLAGVGLSVETASHDIMAIMHKVFLNIDEIIHSLMTHDDIDKEELLKDLQTIRGGMSFIEAQLKDIQLLFRSSKQRRKRIKIIEILEKIERIYKRLLAKDNILLSINVVGAPLIAKTTDAVLLQLFLNLFDNSIYWLQQFDINDKKITIQLDGHKNQLIFSDNGPGVDKDDRAYIFEPFYSGKGEMGRGLGLYIARQLLERNDYKIYLAEIKSEKILSGANFVIDFNISEDD